MLDDDCICLTMKHTLTFYLSVSYDVDSVLSIDDDSM